MIHAKIESLFTPEVIRVFLRGGACDMRLCSGMSYYVCYELNFLIKRRGLVKYLYERPLKML